MKAGFIASAVLLTGLAGCATDYVPEAPPAKPGPEYQNREVQTWKGPGMFGDLRWEWDASGKKKEPASAAQQSAAPAAAAAAAASPATAAEQEEFKKWQESAGRSERQEFEDWRAWREWKKQNPK